MKVDIKVPTMGESVTEAVVSNILKPSGSFVKQDEEILELETDKVNQVLYASSTGQLYLNVKVGDRVTIGQQIGNIDSERKESLPETPPKKPPIEQEVPLSSFSSRSTVKEFISDLQAKEPPKTENSSIKVESSLKPGNRKKMSALRRTIAQRLVEVKNNTAMLTTFNEVDMSKIIEIRAKEKESFIEKHGVKLGFMSFFIKAATEALKAFPEVNAYIDQDDIVYFQSYDIGVAVSTEKGLVVPVIRKCDQLSLAEMEKELEIFAKKAREGSLSLSDLKGGSFTITNGGVFGSLLSTPILNPPQSAILGMHAIVKRPVAINDQIVIRPMMYLALSYDHRIIDGKEAVEFLIHMKKNLEDPIELFKR